MLAAPGRHPALNTLIRYTGIYRSAMSRRGAHGMLLVESVCVKEGDRWAVAIEGQLYC